jgi:N-acylglucosamine 2-epimerase
MNTMSIEELKTFYVDHLCHSLIPFWMDRGIDWENGGYFTCFNNASDKLISTNKYTWSQSRFLWMVSRMSYSFNGYCSAYTADDFLEAAHCGAEFLHAHALLPNGRACWAMNKAGSPILVDREGNQREPKEDDSLEVGITADLFLIYGMGEYARASNKIDYFKFALRLFDSVNNRFSTGDFSWAPQYVPDGYKSHAKSMIMLETAQELASVAQFFCHESEQRLLAIAAESVETTIQTFLLQKEHLLFEFVKEDGSFAFDELIGSTINPGHSLEDSWFILHYAMRNSDEKIMEAGINIVRWMSTVGWDSEYGGIPQFMHKNGGPPTGKVLEQNIDNRMVKDIEDNWYNKLWWVHSEALYALILAYELSGDEWFMNRYLRLHEYVFETFPNPNHEIGEWIQIRNRKGEPEEKVVALPVKDPYHITRAFMHITASLERIQNSRQ